MTASIRGELAVHRQKVETQEVFGWYVQGIFLMMTHDDCRDNSAATTAIPELVQ
jgi:hypothetical protein